MTKIDAAVKNSEEAARPTRSLAKAVAVNAGTVGRQAAVLTAASGLVLTIGLPTQATPAAEAARAVQTVEKPTTISVERVSGQQAIKVTAKNAKSDVKRDAVTSTSTPAPEPEPEVEEVVETTQQSNNNTQSQTQGQSQTQTQNQTQGQNQTQTTNEAAPAEESNQGGDTQIAAAAAPAASSNGLVSSAMAGIGAPYVLGGGTPAGWDCSGFTSWVYAQNGISIPRTTWGIRGSSQFQRVSSPQPGDLVIQNGGGHVVVYVGNGQAVGAQNPSVGTILQSVHRNPVEGYYRYVG